MPLLLTNRFDVLAVEIADAFELVEAVENSEIPSTPTLTSSSIYHIRRPRWQKSLPKRFIIAATDSNPTALKLKFEIKTVDTADKRSVVALVDSGATGEFIDRNYAKSCRFNLSKPIPVYNVDGTPNEAGSITEVVSLLLQYKFHSERMVFAVSSLGKQRLILGHSWL